MLFHSVDFLLLFAVVATQFFRAPALIRGSVAAVALVTPIIEYHGSPASLAAIAYTLAGLAIVALLRTRGREGEARKILLAMASLLFYSAWRWPYVSLLLISTVLDFNCAREIHRADSPRRRRFFLLVSMVGNLGMLGVFKYTNFILGSVEQLLAVTGLQMELGPVPLILPLGISFYTFQTMSYTIDVYRGKLTPRDSLLDVLVFVSFFPQLVAGPILRASQFLSQLDREQVWDSDRAKSGLLLMIWGMAKKLLIADALAPIVEQAYAQPELFSGWALVLATYGFAFQVYCDFSGYSDLAIGASRVLGFDIPLNFNRPFFAANMSTFWGRWHISLSTWLRDYVYISLGGNRKGRVTMLWNLFLTMALGGLWHGANWNCVLWGMVNGLLLVAHRLFLWSLGREDAVDTNRPILRVILSVINFHTFCFTLVFFRAQGLGDIFVILERIATNASGLMVPYLFLAVLMPFLFIAEFFQSQVDIGRALVQRPRLSRLVIYAGFVLLLAVILSSAPVDFIYFVF